MSAPSKGSVARHFARIDPVRSVAAMRAELAGLDAGMREKVIRHALLCSRHQFTWSFFAETFRVPKKAS